MNIQQQQITYAMHDSRLIKRERLENLYYYKKPTKWNLILILNQPEHGKLYKNKR